MKLESNQPNLSSAAIANGKTDLSHLETLPLWELNSIFMHCKDLSTLHRLNSTSKTLKERIGKFIQKQLDFFELVISYVPRHLNPDEKTLSIFHQLEIIRQIVNQTDRIGRTPLIKATIAAKIKPQEALNAMRRLVFIGADLDQKVNGRTAADYGSYWNNKSALNVIEELKEDFQE